jgi:hypothetical protein
MVDQLNMKESNQKNFSYQVEPIDTCSFSSRGFNTLKHNFHNHPLFQMDALRDLAEYLLPRNKCRFVKKGLQQNSEFYHEGQSVDGRSLTQIFDEIELPGSWLALYDVQEQPEYGALLNSIIHQLSPLFEGSEGDFFNVGGFIFISAPPAFTPYHIDRENNFWLQLKGQKKLGLFDRTDRNILPQTQIENFIVNRTLDDVVLTDDIAQKVVEFDVKPGDGVYFPSTTPHMTATETGWAVLGEGVSVSIGIPFYTEWTRHIARLCQYNLVARRVGLPISPLKGYGLSEKVKSNLGYMIASHKKKYRRYNPPIGSY